MEAWLGFAVGFCGGCYLVGAGCECADAQISVQGVAEGAKAYRQNFAVVGQLEHGLDG